MELRVHTCISTRFAPALAKAMAIVWPIPRVAPVITAVLPASEKSDVRYSDDMTLL